MNQPTDEDKDAQEVLLKILEPNPNMCVLNHYFLE